MSSEEGWKTVSRKTKRPTVSVPSKTVVRLVWNGFTESGVQRWYSEMSDGTLIPHENVT
jgi:hypothetical protein